MNNMIIIRLIKFYYKGCFIMIWLYILIPVFIIGGIAIYFEKKSGMIPPDENKQAEKLGEVLIQKDSNSNFEQDNN